MIGRPIAISLSPNTETRDVLQALKLILSPWQFFKGKYEKSLEQWFRQYFSVSYAVGFNSGRSALLSILKALEIGKDDEVILQSFTCVAVPNSVIAAGAKPVYADISNSLTLDPYDLEEKITKKTKAIIIQHTFGIPADLAQIIKISKKYKINIIEDCAHTVGGEYKGKKLGLFGEAAFFSFGRDKAFSCVFGGMAITDNKEIGKKLRIYQKNKDYPNFAWILRQLFHPIAFFIILPIYDFFSLGKILLVLLQKLQMLSLPVFKEEKEGEMKKNFVKKLPNSLACLALFQLKRIKEFNQKRVDISSFYLKELKGENVILPCPEVVSFLRFPLIVENRDECISFLRKNGVYIGKWYAGIIDPKGVNFNNINYQRGLCPNAEVIARKIINLPTYPAMRSKNAEKVVKLLKQYVQNRGNLQ